MGESAALSGTWLDVAIESLVLGEPGRGRYYFYTSFQELHQAMTRLRQVLAERLYEGLYDDYPTG
jgi:hypothetical protein